MSPAKSLATIELPRGYRLELVLSEPQIKEPVVCAFDGNGRMFIAEIRTSMQDAEGLHLLIQALPSNLDSAASHDADDLDAIAIRHVAHGPLFPP